MDTRIYVMTHKECSLPTEEGYHPLQVGASIHDALPYEKDNTGDNISEKNGSYCELTGTYWIWKNIRCDNVGICHYRRYYSDEKAERILVKEEFEKILEHSDVITAWSSIFYSPVYAYFVINHNSSGLDLCRKAIIELCPEYLNSFDTCMNKRLMTGANMIVTRKEIFDKYCEWLFPILFNVEKEIRPDLIEDPYQKRVMGFLGERLMRVWLMMQDIRIHEVRIVKTDEPGAQITYGAD